MDARKDEVRRRAAARMAGGLTLLLLLPACVYDTAGLDGVRCDPTRDTEPQQGRVCLDGVWVVAEMSDAGVEDAAPDLDSSMTDMRDRLDLDVLPEQDMPDTARDMMHDSGADVDADMACTPRSDVSVCVGQCGTLRAVDLGCGQVRDVICERCPMMERNCRAIAEESGMCDYCSAPEFCVGPDRETCGTFTVGSGVCATQRAYNCCMFLSGEQTEPRLCNIAPGETSGPCCTPEPDAELCERLALDLSGTQEVMTRCRVPVTVECEAALTPSPAPTLGDGMITLDHGEGQAPGGVPRDTLSRWYRSDRVIMNARNWRDLSGMGATGMWSSAVMLSTSPLNFNPYTVIPSVQFVSAAGPGLSAQTTYMVFRSSALASAPEWRMQSAMLSNSSVTANSANGMHNDEFAVTMSAGVISASTHNATTSLAGTYNDARWRLLTVTRNTANGGSTRLRINGGVAATGGGGGGQLPVEKQMRIGRHPQGAGQWEGDVAEVALFNNVMNETLQRRVATQLAIKYGLTLSHDYIHRDATTVRYDVSTHGERVFGVGRADEMNLAQYASRSVEAGALLELYVGQEARGVSGTLADGHFVMIGDDDGALTFSSEPIAVPGREQVLQPLARRWKITSNATQPVTLVCSEAGPLGASITPSSTLQEADYLLVSSSPDLTSDLQIFKLTELGPDVSAVVLSLTGTHYMALARAQNL